MGKCYLQTIVLLSFATISLTQTFDWFSLIQSNYAAVQSGLAQLNNASVAINATINTQANLASAAIVDLQQHMAKGLTDLQARFPDQHLNIGSMLNGFSWFTGEVPQVLHEFRQTITDDVMAPSQVVVQNILNAMTEFYFSSGSSSCAQRYAPNLVQARISVGRFAQCFWADMPFTNQPTLGTQMLMNDGKAISDVILGQLKYCSPGSSNCTAAFFKSLPGLMNQAQWNVANLQGFPRFWTQAGVPFNQNCAAAIGADIKDAIERIRSSIASC
uniref:Putative 30.5 kDa secreted protein n=1 Tax=Culex tarsalis TaxID=7177 RepID=A0A1Q3EUZ3_CULTA